MMSSPVDHALVVLAVVGGGVAFVAALTILIWESWAKRRPTKAAAQQQPPVDAQPTEQIRRVIPLPAEAEEENGPLVRGFYLAYLKQQGFLAEAAS